MTKGSSLEKLVQSIEETLAGPGASVECNVKERRDGAQVAEFDLIISHVVGSVSVRLLFECRDRPSDGPQAGDWIQQMAGRRTLFGFDAVTAVSTTGFSRSAVDAAKQLRIGLRTVTALDALTADFNVLPLWVRLRTAILHDSVSSFIGDVENRLSSDALVRRVGEPRFYPLERLIGIEEARRDLETMRTPFPTNEELDGLPEHDRMMRVAEYLYRKSPGSHMSQTIDYVINQPLELRTAPNTVTRVDRLVVPCALSGTDVTAPFVFVRKYEADRLVGAEATYTLTWQAHEYPLRMLTVIQKDNTRRLQVFPPDDAPFELFGVVVQQRS